MERRHAPRFHLGSSIRIEWGTAQLECPAPSISANGVFIELRDPLWVGARFEATLEAGGTVRMDCLVRRVEPGRGMGVQYSVADPAGKKRVASLLERLAGR